MAPATLKFPPNSLPIIDSSLISGAVLNLEYDPIRLSQCRGKNAEGKEDWNIQAYVHADEKITQVFDLIQGQGTLFPFATPISLLVPDARAIEIWFKATDVTGCVQWDSNHNQNYRYDIQKLDSIPSLIFKANWEVEQVGELKGGQPLRIHYDLERATQCRTGGYHGSASWDVKVQLQVDGQVVPTLPITFTKTWSERGQQDIVVILPKGDEMTLWFENSGYEYYAGRHCLAYDSAFGKNYHFDLH